MGFQGALLFTAIVTIGTRVRIHTRVCASVSAHVRLVPHDFGAKTTSITTIVKFDSIGKTTTAGENFMREHVYLTHGSRCYLRNGNSYMRT